MLVFGFHLYRKDNMTNRYKIFTFITTIIFYLYNTINIIHKCTLNCKRLTYKFLLF